MDQLLAGLRAAGEPTRLRLIVLLARGELTVTELTQVLRQSQPRVSRHLKLLCEAGLLDRFPEGSWVFYRLAQQGIGARLGRLLIDLIPAGGPVMARDMERLEAVRQVRAAAAAAYFRTNAADWDRIRALYLPEAEVEAALLALMGRARANSFVDMGTGTGRMLEIFAPRIARGVGVDLSPEMLRLARANLERAGLDHCQVRQGDLYDLPVQEGEADIVTLHQVLHYLDDPAAAIMEAARVLKPGGRLLIADFAPHELDFLRDEQAHRRLGFSEDEMAQWCRQAGLKVAQTRRLPSSGSEEEQLTVLICAADQLNERGADGHRTGGGRSTGGTRKLERIG